MFQSYDDKFRDMETLKPVTSDQVTKLKYACNYDKQAVAIIEKWCKETEALYRRLEEQTDEFNKFLKYHEIQMKHRKEPSND